MSAGRRPGLPERHRVHEQIRRRRPAAVRADGRSRGLVADLLRPAGEVVGHALRDVVLEVLHAHGGLATRR